MNILLIVGLIIILGSAAGRICNKLNIPQVTGYIVLGLFLGESFKGILSGPALDSLGPLISLALGIIGFMIGAELHLDRFKKYSRSIYTILFTEAFLTFLLVGIATFLVTRKAYMALILGALASATAPAATYSVMGEYKSRGPVTMTALSIVALDDGLALIIYGFASAFAKSMLTSGEFSLVETITRPLLDILVSIAIGAIAGYILHKMAAKTRDRDKVLPFTLGTIILVVGLSSFFKVEPILACMTLGAVASNLQQKNNQEMFDLIKNFSSPMFVLFFVLVGARLDAHILTKGGVFVLAVIYIVSRSVGKIAGAYIGGKLSGAKETVTKYLGFCLFDQAGVAVGLAIATYHSFSGVSEEGRFIGITIISLITATTFILQIISPPMIRYGITKADEVNRDITEEDIIENYIIRDVMEADFFIIRENNNIHQIIDIMKKSEAYNFPVIGMNDEFTGIITLGEMRDTFYEEQMDMLILAGDIVMETKHVVYADQELSIAVDIFNRKNIDYLPVLENEKSRKLVGQLRYRKLMDFIEKEVLIRQQELEM